MALITRTNATGLFEEQYVREIVQNLPQSSAVMQLARRLPNMSAGQTSMPVMSGLISAGWVTGDTGQKPTSNVTWDKVTLYAEELAVIVPIPENVLDDVNYDIWAEVRPGIVEAMGAAFDQAVLFGTNAPANFPDDLLTGATAASQTVDHSSFAGDYFDEIFGPGGTMALVEEDGYAVTGHIAALSLKAGLRGLRDGSGGAGTGAPMFMRTMQDRTAYELDGVPMVFPMNGAVDPAQALLFSGDWSKLVYSIRQEITYKLLDQAVLQAGNGDIEYNLPQQDMVAIRAKMRLGWALPRPVTRVNSNATTVFPFSVLVP